MTHDERNGMACTYKLKEIFFSVFSSLYKSESFRGFDWLSSRQIHVSRLSELQCSPYLLYASPIQSAFRLEMPTLSSSNHFPNAWHKFWLSDREVCVWCASECVQLVPNYSLPARGWCRMLLSVHPAKRKGGSVLWQCPKPVAGILTRIAFFNVSASCLKASNSFIFTCKQIAEARGREENLELLKSSIDHFFNSVIDKVVARKEKKKYFRCWRKSEGDEVSESPGDEKKFRKLKIHRRERVRCLVLDTCLGWRNFRRFRCDTPKDNLWKILRIPRFFSQKSAIWWSA